VYAFEHRKAKELIPDERSIMNKFVIMGANGSGKGTQASRLAKAYNLIHISVGDIFRWNIQNHTKLAAKVQRIMNAGLLVPDDVVEETVKARLDLHDWNYGFILDGFPRNITQAMFFLESYDIDAVIMIDVPDDAVKQRMMARRLCSRCGIDYNLIFHRPKAEDTCDVCGGKLVARSDDNPEAIQVRLREYHEKTDPIIDLFRKKELVVVVDGTKTVDEVETAIRTQLHLGDPGKK
jgi:adenylate kinase